MDKPWLIQPVPDESLRAVVRAALGETAALADSRLLPGGQFNTAYYLETRHPDAKLVLRIAPADDKPLFRYERRMMPAEPAIYDLLARNGIPVPSVLMMDGSRTVLDRDYIIHEFVDGLPMNHKDVPESERPDLMRQAGAITARIHAIRGTVFGWPDCLGDTEGGPSWTRVFGDLLEETCRSAVAAGVLPEPDAAAVMDRFRACQSDFDACVEPVLVHNDIWAPNVLVAEGPDGWRVKAILDADRALFADREFEYILWDKDALWEEFMEGYGTPLDESAPAVQRRRFYRFYWYLFAAWCYVAQIGRPDAAEWTRGVAMEALRDVLAES